MVPAEYLKERVEGQIDWYDRNSSRNKNRYFRVQMIIAASSVCIPVLSIFYEQSLVPVLIALLGSITAFSTALVSLF